ncbi:MAG: YtxH domain-containing protein [Bacteroidetes bacterium]|jgi:gas vesicle protein|nr:YtxH domain-containing protein [Bacteroidota bacterium]
MVRSGVLGLLLGGAAGFTLGLLVAPQEGQRLRRRLSYRLEHLGQQVAVMLDEVLSQEADNEARRTANALVADAQERAQRIRDDIDSLLGEIKRGSTVH